MNCPYYLRNLASLTLADQKKFETDPTLFKMHYIYRKFNIDLPTITNDFKDFLKSPININRAYSSQYIIGLCLTYHVNYGMSYRQTSSLLNLYRFFKCFFLVLTIIPPTSGGII